MQCWGEQQDTLNLRRAKGKNGLNMIKIDRVTFSKNFHNVKENKNRALNLTSFLDILLWQP